MAEIKNGILGGVSGKIGTVVGANWRGKNIIRAIPRKSKKAPSLAQLEQRAKFKLIIAFLSPLNAIVSRYFGNPQDSKSRSNLAVAYHLLEAIEQEENAFILNLEKVVLTKGILPNITVASATLEAGTLALTWTPNAGSSIERDTDLITMVIYSQKHKSFQLFEKAVNRQTNALTAPLSADFEAADNAIWLFTSNARDTECSTSLFLGIY